MVMYILRQGAQFVEVWVDGYAFTDLLTRQEVLTNQREELEKQKKMLSKRKGTAQREQMEKDDVLKMQASVLKKVRCQGESM